MIQILTIAFNNYMSIPFEDYKSKLISAIGLFELNENLDEKIKNRLNFIEENTHERVGFNFYALERFLTHRKQEINSSDHKLIIKNKLTKDQVELTESKIHIYLSTAIREIHQLVLKSFEDYKIEQKMNKNYQEEINSDLLTEFNNI
jgi:hypothetical protein